MKHGDLGSSLSKVRHTAQDDKIDPTQRVKINDFLGCPEKPGARIWPVKRVAGKQPYDKVHLQLLVPHTAIPDDTALWFNYDWPKALKAGAEATGKPYSGEFDFVKTEMLWPTTHMVAPASQPASQPANQALGINRRLTLEWVAWAHTAGAFMMLTFVIVIVHVYLTTTGHTPTAHIQSMVTSWEGLHEDPPVKA